MFKKYVNMILACPKMPGIILNITNVCVQKSLKHTLPYQSKNANTGPKYTNTQMHKVCANAGSVSHRDQQKSIDINIKSYEKS